MRVIYVSGSPRSKSNTDWLLNRMLAATGGEFLKLSDYDIQPCRSCWACRQTQACAIDDDMTSTMIPKLLEARAVVVGSPVYFNNVTAQLKAFIDRTWSVRGQLRNRIGGAVVVGRRYGAEGAITALNAFFLKHEMLVANRGVSAIAFRSGEASQDTESVEAAEKLAARILELGAALGAVSEETNRPA